MRFLLTGGSGFIGQNLAAFLAQRGLFTRALVRKTSRVEQLQKHRVELAVGDLETGDGIDRALDGIDCVLHLAGVTKAWAPEGYMRGNVEATRRLAEVASTQASPPRLVYVSSLAAAGPAVLGRPLTEVDEPRPVSTYGRSKFAGEEALRLFVARVPSVIVRPPLVYGPFEKELILQLVPFARLGVALKAGFGPKEYSLVHVRDLCAGILAAAERGKTIRDDDRSAGVYYLSDGEVHTWESVCGSLADALGRRRPFFVPVPDPVGYAAGLASELASRLGNSPASLNRDKAREMRWPAWTCLPDRARRDLGFQPAVRLAEGLRETIGWYRKEGWIS